MKKFLLITTIAFATIAAAPANSTGQTLAAARADSSVQQANDSGTTTPTGAAVEDKKICKLLPTTGTRMSKGACLTAKEWKKVQEQLESNDY